jgi:hypothetical protein
VELVDLGGTVVVVVGALEAPQTFQDKTLYKVVPGEMVVLEIQSVGKEMLEEYADSINRPAECQEETEEFPPHPEGVDRGAEGPLLQNLRLLELLLQAAAEAAAGVVV